MSIVRPLLPFALAATILVALAPAGASATMSVGQAERYLTDLINAQRAQIGLRPLRVDARVQEVARARSSDMARYNYFGHTNSDGRKAWDMMSDAGITWYWAGEILAMNSWGTLEDSADAASRGWHDSSGHYAIISDVDYNYIGVGHAWDADRGAHIWTGVFLKGPDRTGAWSRMGTTSSSLAGAGTTAKVSWRGADVLLSVLTSGFYSFRVQRRVDGGTWTNLYSSTTRTYWSGTLARGHRYDFRVRARDKAGNWGSWTRVRTITT
ncbi:MAG TPA: CAP domain-containing protein [Candidatus Limnocylindrales bacterium]|nr:CAP domain-containing protein [Candidatus Limnocylindrales bacterium]